MTSPHERRRQHGSAPEQVDSKLPRSFTLSPGVHALGDEVSLNLGAMKGHLFVKITRELPATEQERDSSQKFSQ
jgi:hypothetical protein